jgi:5,10-methenyltetrahydrofolate synthetase
MDTTVAAWRRQQRATLLASRQTLSADERQNAARCVGDKLDALVAARRPASIGLFWPIKHELNLLSWAAALEQRGDVVFCLPVVVAKQAPLEYWRWRQGDKMARGIWDIPVPAQRDAMTPDLVLAPMLGFDRANFRLGYGGGYFDRTLAVLRPRPLVVGIGLEFGALDTIFAQPHDIPMDVVVTEARQIFREGSQHAD